MPYTPDDKDWKILEILQEEGRLAFAELGRRIGLSQPAVSERVKRLEDVGIIAGYGAKIDAVALGLSMTAIIRLRTTHEHIQTCLRLFADMPEIVEVYRVTGEDCFVLKVLVQSPTKLEPLVDKIAARGIIATSIVLRGEQPKSIRKGTVYPEK